MEDQAEIAKLKREYRVLHGEKKAYQNEANTTLRKQEKLLQILNNDNKQLKADFKLVKADMSAMIKSRDEIEQLKLQYEGYGQEISNENDRVDSLSKEIKNMRIEVQKAREAKAQLQKASKNPTKLEIEINTMENRVQKSTVDYDKQLATNEKLRNTIDHLTKERRTFIALRGKLDGEGHNLKSSIAQMTEQSNSAYEARSEALAKMAALTERTEKEQTQSQIEIKELTRALEHERKLKDFMGQKGRTRAEELEAAERLRKIKEDAKVKPEQLIKEYDDVFNTIKEISGITNNEVLVDTFIKTEVKTFSLFNLTSELNNNIEKTREQIQEIQDKIVKFNAESQTTGVERKNMLTDLEKKLSVTETRKAQLEEKAAKSKDQVNEIKDSIAGVFKAINCDASVFDKMLGDKEVATTNVMQYLGIIEQKANEMLQQQAVINNHAYKKWEAEAERLRLENAADGDTHYDPAKHLPEKPPKPTSLLGCGPKANSLDPLGSIVTPSIIAEDSDDDDDDGVVLTMEEMRNKVKQKVKASLDLE